MSHPPILHPGPGQEDDHLPMAECDREPPLCWREIVQHAVDGLFHAEHHLEAFLDRAERVS